MATNNLLCKVESLLAKAYKEKQGVMKEAQIGMSLAINDSGRQYLLYSFDKCVKTDKRGKAIELQPYFNAVTDAKSMCDYILFCYEGGKLFVLLIELKQGEKQVSRQLAAGNCFATYLVNTLNRVENLHLVPYIRKISVRDNHIIKKGTSMKSVLYNSDNFCTFEGRAFELMEFLK